MGWSEGSLFVKQHIDVCQRHIKNDIERLKEYRSYLKFFDREGFDWDTQNETKGIDPIWDLAMFEWYKRTFGLEEGEVIYREEYLGIHDD
jgi:hypothetical protein